MSINNLKSTFVNTLYSMITNDNAPVDFSDQQLDAIIFDYSDDFIRVNDVSLDDVDTWIDEALCRAYGA